jgi:hypothetical protein
VQDRTNAQERMVQRRAVIPITAVAEAGR